MNYVGGRSIRAECSDCVSSGLIDFTPTMECDPTVETSSAPDFRDPGWTGAMAERIDPDGFMTERSGRILATLRIGL